jgi:hypothetical protein
MMAMKSPIYTIRGWPLVVRYLGNEAVYVMLYRISDSSDPNASFMEI